MSLRHPRAPFAVIGQPSLDAMCDRAIPGAIRSDSPPALPGTHAE